MILNEGYQIFLCGLFGGFLGELLKWYRLRCSADLPSYIKSPFYWIITILIIISGGLLSLLYSSERMSAIMSLNIGISAPLILQNLSQTMHSKYITNQKKSDEELQSKGIITAYMKNQNAFVKVLKYISG